MTRKYLRFIGKWKQAVLDGVDNLAEIDAGKIGASDAAGKERVADDDHFQRREMEADGALGVAWGVNNLSRVFVESDGFAIDQAFVWRSDFRGRNADPRGLFRHDLEKGQVVFVEKDGGAGEALELECATYVVNVSMGDEDLLELEAEVRETAMNAGHLVAGIDDDGFVGFRVAHQGAVALQRANRKSLEDHVCILWRGAG